MRVVLDTNILLQSIGKKSRMRPIWNGYLNESFNLIATTAILLEYEEKVEEKTNQYVAFNVISLINEALNTLHVEIYFNWNLLTVDPDDNKFFDAAVAGSADYLVSNDAHFNETKSINFPIINIITGEQFLQILNSA